MKDQSSCKVNCLVHSESRWRAVLKDSIHKLLRKVGYDIIRYDPLSPFERRWVERLERYGINLVLDVGANAGQFGTRLRKIGYTGKIVSFEPIRKAFSVLERTMESDRHWSGFSWALGDDNEAAMINIAGNVWSSSFLEMLPAHVKAAPESRYIGKESVERKTLDSIFNKIYSKNDVVYLKMDVQGYEKKVLDGAKDSLRYIDAIQLEMSLTPLYKDELLFHQMKAYLDQYGYRLVDIEIGYKDPESGEVLQIDGFFRRC